MLIAEIRVTLKEGVLDPQGTTLRRSLETLGFAGLGDVRMGKFIRVAFGHGDRARAEAEADAMCKKVLTNPVIEQYHFTVREE
ncbi:MAG: phosphoribosylformylglycinamidine synthase subunit PurS [Candidatus Edwardsbacteria bacterium]|nr:phosphoribosylformylglycinamidine synthase subunit PurS [Candidatus Edwardsbacteria bacterium]